MGLISKALDFLRTPISPEGPAETVVGSTRNAVVDVFKMIPSIARAIAWTPVALTTGSVKAVGTFLKNRVTLNERRWHDIWSRITDPLSGNPFTRAWERHKFEERAHQTFAKEFEYLGEPVDLAVDAGSQVPNALRAMVKWVREEVPRIILGSGESPSGAGPEPNSA